jgi:hypothetical protein
MTMKMDLVEVEMEMKMDMKVGGPQRWAWTAFSLTRLWITSTAEGHPGWAPPP